MKKYNCYWLLACFIGLFLISCDGSKKNYPTDTISSGEIFIAVDESFAPIIQSEISVYEAIYTNAHLKPIYTSEMEAINLLLKDSVRFALTTRLLTESETAALKQKQLYAKNVRVATDAIALVVNKQNLDSLMSIHSLRKILTGEVTTWKELNPESKLGKIDVVFDNPNSSAVRYAIDSICKDKGLSTELYAQKTNTDVIDYVRNSPNALGIIGVSWVSNQRDSTCLSFLENVTVMAVSRSETATVKNSYQPYQAYMQMGDYPLNRDIYIILTDPRDGLATGFATFIGSDRGQRIILKSGIVPAIALTRVVNVRENL